jgi:hypothetical protein
MPGRVSIGSNKFFLLLRGWVDDFGNWDETPLS